MIRVAIITAATILFYVPRGCEKNVDIKIDEIEHMIVLNSTISPDSVIEVTLSRTRHILDNASLNKLTNGTVEISDEQGNTAQLSVGEDGIYRTSAITPVAGREYMVKASIEGYTDVEATTVIPNQIPIATYDTSSVVTDWGNKNYSFEITINDPADEENYYGFSMSSLTYYLETYIQEVRDTLYETPDTVIVAITLDTTFFYRPSYNYVYFNSDDVVIEEDAAGHIGIIFSDKLFNGKSYTLKGTVDDYYLSYSADTATLYFSLKSISKDYFKYLYSYEKHTEALDDFFATPVTVQNNITGGVGIFGSYSVYMDSLKFAPSEDPYPWYGGGYYYLKKE